MDIFLLDQLFHKLNPPGDGTANQEENLQYVADYCHEHKLFLVFRRDDVIMDPPIIKQDYPFDRHFYDPLKYFDSHPSSDQGMQKYDALFLVFIHAVLQYNNRDNNFLL